MWLLTKLFAQGDQPTPRFAFQGTVFWMRALAILVQKEGFAHMDLSTFYASVQRRNDADADILALEKLVMAMHNVAAIDAMKKLADPYECVRSAIVAWYYAVYWASKAMLAACSGSDPQTHAKTGRIWQTEIVSPGRAKSPFSLSISDITPKNIEASISSIRGNNPYNNNEEPISDQMAWGAAYSYLKGTAEYRRWELEEEVKNSPQYRSGGYTSFRTNAAKALRDQRLSKSSVNFLVQAFRFRGKANYRDAIYLSYGNDYTSQVKRLTEDCAEVSRAFVLMAAHYTSRRIDATTWQDFCSDIAQFKKFTLPFDVGKI